MTLPALPRLGETVQSPQKRRNKELVSYGSLTNPNSESTCLLFLRAFYIIQRVVVRAQLWLHYSSRVNAPTQLATLSNAAAEEVLRVIYGDDLAGCAVSLDSVAAVIRAVFQEHAAQNGELSELYLKGFEAVHLLATPPADGHNLSPDDLRSLLSERLDSIRGLATRILSATRAAPLAPEPQLPEP